MNVTLQTINISAKSKFGVLDATTNKWFNPKEKDMLSEFNVGQSYNVELSESQGKDGKTYVNITKVVGARGPVADAPVTVPVVVAKPAFKKQWGAKKADVPITDWAAKDRSQLVGGLCHDAAALAAAVISTGTTVEAALEKYKALLDGVLRLREGVK